jgi:hypothetical protein
MALLRGEFCLQIGQNGCTKKDKFTPVFKNVIMLQWQDTLTSLPPPKKKNEKVPFYGFLNQTFWGKFCL